MKHCVTKLSNMFQCTGNIREILRTHLSIGCDSFWVNPLGKAVATKNGNFKFTPAVLHIPGSVCPDCGHNLRVFSIIQ